MFEKLTIFLENHFTEIKENPELGKILVKEKEFPHQVETKAIAEYLSKIPELIEKMIIDSIENGEISRDLNPEITAAAIFGAIQGIVERTVSNGKFALLDDAEREIVRLLKNGLE
ncbi:MAG: TetR/AcrR family transcriptional regulator C-terminal domain-containing protein [Halanaerobiales bacterium]